MASITCPRCGFTSDDGVECARCGVVFAKLEAAAQAPASVPAAEAPAPAPVTRRTPLSGRRAAMVLRQLGRLVDAGVPIGEALGTVAAAAADSELAAGLVRVREGLSAGEGLAQACGNSGLFTEHQLAWIAAGEQTGNLGDKLALIAAESERRLRLRRQVLGALAYPSVLVILASFILPASLALTAGIGAYLEAALTPILIVGGIGLALFVGLPALLRRVGRGRPLALLARALPLLAPTWTNGRLAAFCACAADSLGAGLPVEPSLRAAAAAADDALLVDAVEAALARVQQGAGLAVALETSGVLPPDLLLALKAGEASGTLPAVLREMAVAYGEDHEHALRRLVGVLALVAALLVILVVVAMIVLQYAQIVDGLEDQLQDALKGSPTLDNALEDLHKNFEMLDRELNR